LCFFAVFPLVCAAYACFFLIFPVVCAAYALLEPTTVAEGRPPTPPKTAIMATMKSFFTVISLVEVHGLTLIGCARDAIGTIPDNEAYDAGMQPSENWFYTERR